MSNVSKGNYYLNKFKKFLEADGWRVEKLEKNYRIFTKGKIIFVKKDLWGADLIAVKGEEEMWVQWKTNKGDIAKGLKELANYPMPSRVKQCVATWAAKAKEPEIIEVEK